MRHGVSTIAVSSASGERLAEAIGATFRHPGTAIEAEPVGLPQTYCDDVDPWNEKVLLPVEASETATTKRFLLPNLFLGKFFRT